MMERVRRGAAWVLDLIFPPRCAFCGTLLDGEREVCALCRDQLPWAVGQEGERKGEFFSRCVFPLRYQDMVRRGIHGLKFEGRSACAGVYGAMMARCVRERLEGPFHIVTWVPVSRARLRRRGYDQARLLAREVAEALGKHAMGTLRKVRHNQPQSSLTGDSARRANALDCYRAVEPRRLAGRRVLLVDDVITSGATLSECARVLLSAGAVEVCCVTLAGAGKGGKKTGPVRPFAGETGRGRGENGRR